MARHLVCSSLHVTSAVISLIAVAWLAQPAAAQSTVAKTKPAKAADSADNDPFGASSKPAQRPVLIRGASRDAGADHKIRDALSQSTQLEFVETPLSDAIDYLKDFHHIDIELDDKALEEAGIGTDTPVTRELKDLTLGSSLRLLLEPLEATYVVRDGVLLITTPGALDKMIELRVYNVGDLVPPDGDQEELAGALKLALIEEPQVARFRELLVVRASIAQHELVEELLAELRAKLKDAD
jgi:hypothetical protein